MKESPNAAHRRSVLTLAPSDRLYARKSLGQHFLNDASVLQRIVEASDLGPHDTVVEVGPGLGVLTAALVQRVKRVIAIEIDPRLADRLPASLNNPPNLRVINADAREVELAKVLDEECDYRLVANLPYYAANPIMMHFLERERNKPALMVVMVQAEVASRMLAEGGRMSLLAIGIQLYGVPSIVCCVPPEAFHPRPKVHSAVVRIDVHPSPAVELEDVEEFFDIVRAGFAAPRKQLRNSLSLGLGSSPQRADDLLVEAGVDPKRRAETLNLEEWRRLCLAAR